MVGGLESIERWGGGSREVEGEVTLSSVGTVSLGVSRLKWWSSTTKRMMVRMTA